MHSAVISDTRTSFRGVHRGLALALLLGIAAAAAFPRLSADWHLKVLAPAWMPQQIVKLLEYSNDVQVAFLADRRDEPHPDVALVLIREETLASLPYLSPIDRGLLARLVRAVDAMGARAIGLDILFDQATEPGKDKELASVLRSRRAEVVLGAADGRTPLNDRRRAWQADFARGIGRPVGFLNLRYDVREAAQTHVVRNRAAADGPDYPLSFAEALARAGGVTRWPATKRIPWLAPPHGGGETFPTFDADGVLDAETNPDGPAARILERQLQGKLVLIGADLDAQDRHPTPLSLITGEPMLGVNVHAQILAGLIDGRTLHDVGPIWLSVLGFVSTFAGVMLGWMLGRRGLWLTLALAAAVVLQMATSAFVLWQSRAIVPVAGLTAAMIAGAVAARYLRRWIPA
ncbi:MAG: CHASE2 domain-containing protein [Hyphomicrobiaceae bacterium]